MPTVPAVAACFVLLAALVAADLPYEGEGDQAVGAGMGEVMHARSGRGHLVDTSLAPEPVDALVELDENQHPLTLAKLACQAGWTETKKQCGIITTATVAVNGMEALKGAIRNAGSRILSAVEAIIPESNATATSEFLKLGSKLEAEMSSLGEGMGDSNTPSAAALQKTMGHMACKALWQQVEALCSKVDSKASHGTAAVTQSIQSEGAAFEAHANTVAGTPMPGAPGNTSQVLMESNEAPYHEGEYVQSMDNTALEHPAGIDDTFEFV